MKGPSRDLCVLLVPAVGLLEQGDTSVPIRAALAGQRDLAICSLSPHGSLNITAFPLEGAQSKDVHIEGRFQHFMWEKASENPALPAKLKILTMREDWELAVYELTPGDGALVPVCNCKPEILKQLLATGDTGLSCLQSVRILAFENRSFSLLLNDLIVAQMSVPERGGEAVTVGWFCLRFPPAAPAQVVDVQLCSGVLFLLNGAQWIYVFDASDGEVLAHVDLTAYQVLVQEDTERLLVTLKVSDDLQMAVITNGSDQALALDLNVHFRQYPEQLLGLSCSDTGPLTRPEGIDEDRLKCSTINMKLLKRPFQSDRSWKAQLSTVSDVTKRHDSVPNTDRPWYQVLPHYKRYQAGKEHMQPCARPRTLQSRTPKVEGDTRRWRRVPGPGSSRRLQCVSLSRFTALLTLSEESEVLSVVLWDLQSQDMSHHCISPRGISVLSDTEQDLCLVLTDAGLSVLLFGLTQEDFLNRLMIHGSASAVDTLCHINHWDRCSIPLHALEAGLKNRQLDTVNFFLKSKESIFSPPAGGAVPQPPRSTLSTIYLRNLEELRPALDLLCFAIRENDLETQSKPFSEQLLNLTLRFLNSQFQEICRQADELDACSQSCMEILTSYITNLRTFMKKFNQRKRRPLSMFDEPHIEYNPLWASWSSEQVFADAILSNKIPEAQTFLRLNAKKHSLEQLIRVGLDLAYDQLLKENVTEASLLLRNMGLNVKQEQHRICLYTGDKNIRNLLIRFLEREQYLSEGEKELIENVCRLEDVYCKSLPSEEEMVAKPRCWWASQDRSNQEVFLGSFLQSNRQEEIDTSGCSVILQWAQHWDKLIQEGILLSRKSDSDLSSCLPDVLWTHFTSLHDWPKLSAWIESSLRQGCLQAPNGGSWPLLSTETVDQHTLSSRYMRQEILDRLARSRVFVPSELRDPEVLPLRLASNGGLMQKHLSVPEKLQELLEAVSQDPSSVPQERPSQATDSSPVPQYRSLEGPDFHTQFILYCVQHSVPYLLYTYLDYYSLTPSNCEILGSREVHKAHPWFELLVQVRSVTENPGDLGRMFSASLANAQILIPSEKAGLSSMLLEGHTLLALASAMYTAGGVDQIAGGQGLVDASQETVDSQLLKVALTPYPKLKAALFPQCTSHSIMAPDVSLYHLLQTLAPFDPARLFGWQSTNTLAGTDLSSDLPHFSSLDLVNKYAVIERLDFLYYLRHGRPAFAFGNFLVQQLGRSKSRKQLIEQVSLAVYALALSSLGDPSVITACVCFLELLGADSLKLRVDMKVAHVILKHKSANDGESQASDVQEALGETLMRLLESEQEAAQDLLTWLETVFWDSWADGLDSTGEELLQWSLVMMFCKLHDLQPSTSYLRDCAKSHNWLEFIIQAQIHSYQPEQVHTLLADFGDVPLRDHLALAFENLQFSALAVGDDQEAMRREVKTTRYRPPRSATSDVFQVLFCSMEDPSPWTFLLAEAVRQRLPVFSVLAACLQGASIVRCLCVWIITWVDESTAMEAAAHLEDAPETHEWGLQDLSIIWKTLLRKQRSRALTWAFKIFLKDCPLLSILEVYELCMQHKDYTEAKAQLLTFQQSLLKLKAPEAKEDVLLPTPWLEARALFLLELMMQQCQTQYEFGNLMQLFADLDTVLISNGLDVQTLCALSKIIKDTSISIDRSVLSDYSPEKLRGECASILVKLQEQKLYSLAKAVAALGDLPVDALVIEELNQDKQTLQCTDQWHRRKARIDFWRKCQESFSSHHISSQAASAFFSSQARTLPLPPEQGWTDKIMEILSEKRLLLSLAGHWLGREDPVPLETLESLEHDIWQCRITQQVLITENYWIQGRYARQVSIGSDLSFDQMAQQFCFSKLTVLNTSECLRPDCLPCSTGTASSLGRAEVQALNHLIGRLLDESCVHEASRVCRYFDFVHRDVSLVLHCRALAAGEVDVNDEHPVLQGLLRDEEADEAARARKYRLHREPSLESPSSFILVQHPDAQLVQDLERLTEQCIHGKNYCRQVLCLYQLSKELECTYCEISAQDSHQLLRAILSSPQPNTCEKAQAFISTQGLQPQMVAELVAEELLRQIQAGCEGRAEKPESNLAGSREAFLQLAKLCQDPTLVGMELLEKLGLVPHGELACIVEILIAAHECFTLTCHLEGIIRVLQASQHLTENHLAPSDEYKLMVRLLTGIGRYSEMTYIFRLLHQKHHFEVLMKKNMDKNGGLKTALLDYIKRFHPGDSEKYNMVVLCFSMHREIAENHEAAANVQLKLIESLPWEESLSKMAVLKASLMKALTLLIDASESYGKKSCVRQSLRCARLAKLLTLQLHFLNNGQKTKLINLDSEVLLDAIRALPRFYQASIVAEAYGIIPDWAEVLYKRVVIDGEFLYLEEFKQHHLLKGSVFEDISKKFQQHSPSASAVHNLKKVLSYCEDIFLYYQLAYENKFYDVTNMLLTEPQTGCCLKDMLSC